VAFTCCTASEGIGRQRLARGAPQDVPVCPRVLRSRRRPLAAGCTEVAEAIALSSPQEVPTEALARCRWCRRRGVYVIR
jgi:hypothetical protein